MFFKKKEIKVPHDNSLERRLKWEKDVEKADAEFQLRVRKNK